MDNFTFYAPTYFDFGKGAEKHVADLIKKCPATNKSRSILYRLANY